MYHNKYELKGLKFNMLYVIDKINIRAKDGAILRECICDCGNKTILKSQIIAKGITKSCGCLAKINLLKSVKKHGMTKSKEFTTWQKCISRCINKNNHNYKWYGAKGIKCERNTFEKFYSDMGPCPGKEYSIERINSELGYCKENCKWATNKEQSRNRRSNIFLEYNGITKCITDWSNELGISYSVLKNRINKGLSIEDCIKEKGVIYRGHLQLQ